MRLILHAGTHKTGTTSIQRVLLENRQWLGSQGLFVPSNKPKLGHHKFSRAFSYTNPDARRKAMSFIGHAEQNAMRRQGTIISSEQIYRRVSMTKGDFLESKDSKREEWSALIEQNYWERRDDYLEQLATALRDFDVEVVLYFRAHQYFLSWLHGTIIKNTSFRGDLESFRDEFGNRFSYDRQLEVFKRQFKKVRTYRYEDAKHSLMTHFFDNIGFPTPPDASSVRLNRSDVRNV